MTSKVLGMIGLAQRAGKLLCGVEICEKAAKVGKVKLLLVDAQTAANSYEKIERAARMNNIPLCAVPEGLGDSIGKPGRVACAVIDEGFAKEIYRLLSLSNSNSVVYAGV